MARRARQSGLFPDARPLLCSADRALSRLLAPGGETPRARLPPFPPLHQPAFDGWLRSELDRLYPQLRDTAVARKMFAHRFYAADGRG